MHPDGTFLRNSIISRCILLLTIVQIIVYKYVYMKNTVTLFKLLSDETRVRILMLLSQRELCVCQLMGVLSISQPLVSRNLSLLSAAGLLAERKEGKLVFYRLDRKTPGVARTILGVMSRELKSDETFLRDLQSLSDCTEFQKKTGKCDMKTFLAFMEEQRKKRGSGKNHGKASFPQSGPGAQKKRRIHE
jgi:ArsR family transcriptional regulator